MRNRCAANSKEKGDYGGYLCNGMTVAELFLTHKNLGQKWVKALLRAKEKISKS